MSNVDRRALLSGLTTGSASAVLGLWNDLAVAAGPSWTGPMRLIVPAAPNTRHSLSSHLFARAFSRVVGQEVEVVNPDCSPGLALELIAGGPADGRTLGFTTMDLTILHWLGQTNVDPGSLTPIALINEDPAAVFVRADSPYRTMGDLLADIRARPGKLRATGTPERGIWHLSTVGWLTDLGLDGKALSWVSSASPRAALEDMAQGASDVLVCGLPFARFTPLAKKVRVLGVMSHTPIPRFPDAPTMRSATGRTFASGSWRGLVAPKVIAPALAARLAAAARQAWESAEFQLALHKHGYVPAWRGEHEFARYIEAADSRMGAALRALGAV